MLFNLDAVIIQHGAYVYPDFVEQFLVLVENVYPVSGSFKAFRALVPGGARKEGGVSRVQNADSFVTDLASGSKEVNAIEFVRNTRIFDHVYGFVALEKDLVDRVADLRQETEERHRPHPDWLLR